MTPDPDPEAKPATFRWCPNGPPEPPWLNALARDAEGLPYGFVVCSCDRLWACNDPETIPRGPGRTRSEPPGPSEADLFLDRA